MGKNQIWLYAFLVVTYCTLVFAQSKKSDVEERIDRVCAGLEHTVTIQALPEGDMTLSARMHFYRVPGVSVAVIHNGKLDWARGFGEAYVGGSKVTPQTRFQAASMTKPVTAVGALRLVKEGKLKLDEDVNTYLKAWKVPENTFTAQKKVSLRELLNHTAGMNVHGFPGFRVGEPMPNVVEILNGSPPANTPAIRVEAIPGTRWSYSGGGYVVVQRLVSDVTGMEFAKFMQDAVLRPLRMTRSTFGASNMSSGNAEYAMPYDTNGQPLAGVPRVIPDGPGGLWTTPTDMASFLIEIQKELNEKSERILSAAIVKDMLTPGLGHQGLGFLIEGNAGHLFFSHEGNNPGYQSKFVASFDGQDGAVVMTNGDRGWQLMNEILRSIAREYGWTEYRSIKRNVIRVEPSTLDRLIGTYGGYLIISKNGDKLMGEIPGGVQKAELYPESPSRYFFRDTAIEIHFDMSGGGNATAVEFITPMVHNTLKKTR